MNAQLYANWDGAVGENDTLIFVGDVAMRTALCDAHLAAYPRRSRDAPRSWLSATTT